MVLQEIWISGKHFLKGSVSASQQSALALRKIYEFMFRKVEEGHLRGRPWIFFYIPMRQDGPHFPCKNR